MCGLPPGASDLLTPVVMTNLLGGIWDSGTPAWEHILKEPYAHLHLYGKNQARPGRKMGHLNATGDRCRERAVAARARFYSADA